MLLKVLPNLPEEEHMTECNVEEDSSNDDVNSAKNLMEKRKINDSI